MRDSIFSTYRTGENRVTASILAVLRSLSLDRTQRLLGAVMEQSEFELIHFQNQPSKGGRGVPDAEISSNFRILLETKIKRGAVKRDQLKQHLCRFQKGSKGHQYLLVLTPDESLPTPVEKIEDPRLFWASFASLEQAIDEMLQDGQEVVSEREAFLLRELQKMFVAEKLVGSTKDAVVVPARNAWNCYRECSAYVCQSGRTFQPVKYIAFYTANHIQALVPMVLGIEDEVVFEEGRHEGQMRRIVDTVLALAEQGQGTHQEGKSYKVFRLSAPDASETIRLDRPIPNDLRTASGRTTAFTQNQRYVQLEDLRRAQRTSDLARE